MSTRVNAFSDSVAVHLDGLKEVRPTRFHLPLLSLSMSGPPESPLHGLLPPALVAVLQWPGRFNRQFQLKLLVKKWLEFWF